MIECIILSYMVLTVENDVCIGSDADPDPIFAERRVGRASRCSGRATGGHHKAQREVTGKVHLIGYDLEERGNARFGITVEFGTHASKIDFRFFIVYFDNRFVLDLVHEGTRVVDPASAGGSIGG